MSSPSSANSFSNYFLKKNTFLCYSLKNIYICIAFGEMAEWSIAAVLKTVEVRASGGSNPSLSARNYWINRTKTYKLLICRFFIVYRLCFQDSKRIWKTEFRYEIVTLFLPDKNGNDLSENDSWKSEFYPHTNNSYLKHYHWFYNLKCKGLKSFSIWKKVLKRRTMRL